MQEWVKKTIRLLAYGLRGFLSRHKKRLMLAGLLALAFMITGIIVPAGAGEKSVNYIIIMRSEGGFNIIGSYFKTQLTFLLCFAVIFAGVIIGKLKILSYITVCFAAYRFGSLINCAITEDAAGGAVFLVIYLIPVYTAFIASMITALCMVSEAGPATGGKSPICSRVVKEYSVKLSACFGANAAIGIIFNIIVPSVVKLIVVV